MPKVEIPVEWELRSGRRHKRQDMERAMGGRIERGLVELITNSDDSYGNLEDEGKRTSGKIRIEIERRKMGQPSTVIVRDRAEGMSRLEMYEKLGTLGERSSGFEKGKPRRGLHGRGARDVAAFGTVHFESIKEDEYNHLVIPPSLKCRFVEPHPRKATSATRRKLGIPKGNGTVVTIDVESRFISRIPHHETLVKDFSRYYSLRDMFSNPNREVTLVDRNKKRVDQLCYKYPTGELIYDHDIEIPDYPMARAHLVIFKHPTPFEQGTLTLAPHREGILVKSAAAIHDCTYLGLESEASCWRLTGHLFCEYIDQLIRQYDDREEANPDHPGHPANNPQRLLDPFRDGLILEHPFVRALYKKCKETLSPFVEELKAAEESPKREVTDTNLEKKLRSLSREISKVFENKLRELEEEVPPEDIPEELREGLHIIPPKEQPVIVNQPKTFSLIVKNYETLDDTIPVSVVSSDPDKVRIRTSPVFLRRLLEDGKVGRTTFTVESDEIGAEACIEAVYNGYSNSLLIKVVPPPAPPPLPDGLTFEKPLYHLQINKEKALVLRLKTTIKPTDSMVAEMASDHPDIVVKGGGRCILHETDMAGVLHGQCRVLGRQLKAQGKITARVDGFESTRTSVKVKEREEPPGGVQLRFKPDERHSGALRYAWDDKEPYLLWIDASHPSIRRYLGEPTDEGYPGRTSPLYHTVLAEVIAEALAFRLLKIHFKRDGQQGMLDYDSTDLYYHMRFSEFLSIAHKILVTEFP